MKRGYVIALKRNEYDTVNYLYRDSKGWHTDTNRWNATFYNKIARASGIIRLLDLQNEAYVERVTIIDGIFKLLKEKIGGLRNDSKRVTRKD